jgi:hypothetical protein
MYPGIVLSGDAFGPGAHRSATIHDMVIIASGSDSERTESVESIVRAAIDKLLRDYISAPLFNAREKDYQAVLFAVLRARVPGQVPATFTVADGRTNTRHSWQNPRTSRVHMEMSLGKKGRAGESTKPDIVVLRDRPVVLRCSVDGPADVQETLRVDDVEVAIELKAAPSQNGTEAGKFARDVAKLASAQREHPHLRCFAVVIDKSISTPCASSNGIRIGDWLGMVDTSLRRHAIRPHEPHVEVWFVEPRSVTPGQTYFSL